MEATRNGAGKAAAALAGGINQAKGDAAIGAGAANSLVDKEAREKTWDEMTDPERIRRLRTELRITKELVQSQQALVERLMVHGHLPSGEMCVPMSASGGRATGTLLRGDRLA